MKRVLSFWFLMLCFATGGYAAGVLENPGSVQQSATNFNLHYPKVKKLIPKSLEVKDASLQREKDADVFPIRSTSEPSINYSVKIESEAKIPPYLETFQNIESFQTWTVLNGGQIDTGNNFNYSYAGNLFCYVSPNDPSDTWAISPGVKCEGGKYYMIAVEAWSGMPYNEAVGVSVGRDVSISAMSDVLIPLTEVTPTRQTLSTIFACPEDGIYHFGIHGFLEANTSMLSVDNFSVGEPLPSTTPTKVDNLQVIPDDHGALITRISFNAPKEDLEGNELQQLDGVEIARDGIVLRTSTPEPGEKVDFEDAEVTGGNHSYTVTPFGSAKGESLTSTVFLGYEMASAPQNLKIFQNENKLCYTWDPVTTDINGKIFDPGDIVYNVYDNFPDMVTTAENHYERDLPEEGQAFYSFNVTPVFNGNLGYVAQSEIIAAGKPYTIPFHESFVTSNPDEPDPEAFAIGKYDWLNESLSPMRFGHFSYYVANPGDGADADGQYLGFTRPPVPMEEKSRFMSGLIEIPADLNNPVMRFAYWCGGSEVRNTITAQIQETLDSPWRDLAIADCKSDGETEQWKYITIDMTPYLGKTIRIGFLFTLVDYPESFLDDIFVGEQHDKDLALGTLLVKNEVKAGEILPVQILVQNRGTVNVDDYSIDLMCNGEKIATIQGQDISPMSFLSFIYEYATNPSTAPN